MTDVHIPGIGDVDQRYVVGGAALVAGIVGYAWWKNGTAAPADVPAYNGGDVSGDLVTDIPGGAAGAPANSGGAAHDSSTTPDTDAEWAQMAADALESSYELKAISTALGRYLTGQTLTAQQETIVRAAIAYMGYPPGGHYPIKTGGGSTPSALEQPTGVYVSSTGQTWVTIHWDAVTGADDYRVYCGGSFAEMGGTDLVSKVEGLQPGQTYTLSVSAVDASGRESPRSAPVTAHTDSKPAPSKPAQHHGHHTLAISDAHPTLSELTAYANRKYHTNYSWRYIWDYNLQHRSAATRAKLRARGPNRVYHGSTFWFPY